MQIATATTEGMEIPGVYFRVFRGK